ncbi:sigma-70 family RNA polymerase sigma factor [Piscinibacter terrae]|nr:sigma-70 family RNA polymerase sigma factor [Albitalea terrae]
MPLAIAHRFLSLCLHNDYLSAGQGHRNSRRVVAERHDAARRALPQPAGRIAGEHAPGAQHPIDGAAVSSCDAEARYLIEVAQRPRLTSREEYGLAARMRSGDLGARNALVEANLGLVVMFARRYQRPGLPMLDLVAEGNFGLLSAAQRFDPERGVRFATYAKWWVMRAMHGAVLKLTGVVRMPAATSAVGGRRDRADPGEVEQSGEDVAVLAVEGDDSLEDRTTDLQMAADVDTARPVHGAPMPAAAGRPCACPGLPMDDEDVLSTMAMPEEHEPQEQLMTAQRTALVRRVLDGLPERDRTIIDKRFALTCEQACTLDELAREFMVSIERIRQVEKAALGKLQRALGEAGECAQTLL